ncbi:MAG TPA: helix-turn-helix domain-containing protein [Baekduia sp.]|nr:helix-turn-helix domain-containing protein [Baekduia sp.]
MGPPITTTKRTLSTADERREALIEAAVRVFSARGYHATPTTEIAKAAGISQAYLFRLFPTKAELFAAAADRARDRMLAAFEAAGRTAPEGEELDAMGHAYAELVDADRDILRLQLQSQVAAPSEPCIEEAARRCFAALYELVGRLSGADDERLRDFFAKGMLINVMTAIGADELDAPWAQALTHRDRGDRC